MPFCDLMGSSKRKEQMGVNCFGILTQKLQRYMEPHKDQPESDWLVKLNEYLEQSLASPQLIVGDIARVMELSERQLYRKVKKHTGYTPVQYLRHLRMQRAQQLLEEEAVDTVAELALRVGYIRPDYFSTLFREHFGSTPSELLRDQEV